MSVGSDPDWSSSCLLLRRSHCSIAPPIRDRDKRVGVLRTHHPFRATYVGYVRNWETLPVESLAHIRFDIGLAFHDGRTLRSQMVRMRPRIDQPTGCGDRILQRLPL